MPNRLAHETSPYLLQHQNNPVDWYPWGEEAFEKARREDKPIFLSVGYSSCHWCHVMEHESFEDEEVAGILNSEFVPVKVDREERPDVDEAYMTAVQLTSGRGGWPMSVFMTPDRRPFFAGTYFPKTDRGQHPGFLSVCAQIGQAWRERREEIEQAADQIADAIRQTLGQRPPATSMRFDQEFLDRAVRNLLTDFDPENGGFGGAPKFPPHTSLRFLMSYATGTTGAADLREAALGASLVTLRNITLGGIHDHVGGGFHRYSTDSEWLLPHFEKMLYDNALMLGNLAHASVIAEGFAPEMANHFRMAAGGIIGWLSREMTSPEGWFYSALDADSEGEEGRYYVWTADEVRAALAERADAFLQAYGFQEEGNFQDEATGHRTGANIPHLKQQGDDRFDPDLELLAEKRLHRVRPGLDDKGLVGWNGLMITSLCDVGLLPMAARAAEALLAAEVSYGRLPHGIAKGRAFGEAFLEDYAYFAEALFRLAAVAQAFEMDGEAQPLPRPWADYARQAERLGREMVERFYDAEAGAFFASSDRHESLFGRTKPVFDQPIPSANAGALSVLLELGDEERARKSLAAVLGWMERAPSATEALFAAALPLLDSAVAIEAPAVAPAPVAAPVGEVEITLTPREIMAGPDGKGTAEVLIRIPEGLHINSSEPPARWLTPTRVEVRPVKAEVQYPVATEDRYEGEIRIPVFVQLPAGESGAEFEVRVSYQACTETECLLPKEKTFGAVLLRP